MRSRCTLRARQAGSAGRLPFPLTPPAKPAHVPTFAWPRLCPPGAGLPGRGAAPSAGLPVSAGHAHPGSGCRQPCKWLATARCTPACRLAAQQARAGRPLQPRPGWSRAVAHATAGCAELAARERHQHMCALPAGRKCCARMAPSTSCRLRRVARRRMRTAGRRPCRQGPVPLRGACPPGRCTQPTPGPVLYDAVAAAALRESGLCSDPAPAPCACWRGHACWLPLVRIPHTLA